MRPLINDDIALAAAIRLPAGGAPDRAPGRARRDSGARHGDRARLAEGPRARASPAHTGLTAAMTRPW